MLRLSGNPAADELVSGDPFALLIGAVLDQQVPLERAFGAPLALKERLGGRLSPEEIASMDPDRLASVFAAKPALHRFPAANARRVQDLSRLIVERYGGEADRIWKTASSGEELLGRLRELPGFGEQKAQIFLALLGKQLGVQPPGWREAAGRFGEPGSHFSIADIVDEESLAAVRAHKAQMKAAARAKA